MDFKWVNVSNRSCDLFEIWVRLDIVLYIRGAIVLGIPPLGEQSDNVYDTTVVAIRRLRKGVGRL